MKEITLERLPATAEELAAMPQAALTVPEEVAALTIAALARFPENQEDAVRMLDFLRGPRPLNGIDKQFLKDRFRGKEYLMRSFFAGSSPENNYTPSMPYRSCIRESIQQKPACGRISDTLCKLQRRRQSETIKTPEKTIYGTVVFVGTAASCRDTDPCSSRSLVIEFQAYSTMSSRSLSCTCFFG